MKLLDLFEALPLKYAKQYRKIWSPETNLDLFKRFEKYSLDKHLYRLKFNLKNNKQIDGEDLINMSFIFENLSNLTVQSADNIEWFLETKIIGFIPNDYLIQYNPNSLNKKQTDKSIITNYINGYISNGIQTIKIGKVLTTALKYYNKLYQQNKDIIKESKLQLINNIINGINDSIKLFNNDPTRQTNFNKENYAVIISRHPYDIAGMSTGRDWDSCLNIINGENRRFMKPDVQTGMFVAYLVKENDNKIDTPLARFAIYPLHNQNNIVYKTGDCHGATSIQFKNFIDKFLRIINKGKPDGEYKTPVGYLGNLSYHKEKNKVGYKLSTGGII